MDEKKTSKLQEIRATASDAAEIMRQIGTPGVLESLNHVKETASQINGIIHVLKTPEMVRNIENFRQISENLNDTASKIQETVQQLQDTGVIDKTSDLIVTAKGKIDSFGSDSEDNLCAQDLRNVTLATKEMFVSIKELMNELTITVASSKTNTVGNIKDTIKEISYISKTISSTA